MRMMMAALLAAQAAGPAGQPPAPARPDPAAVLAAVRAEWPRYDAGGDGRLTPLEFSTWVMRSHGGSVAAAGAKGQGIRPTSAMNAASAAFARADANHDGGVTPEEMAGFLTRRLAMRAAPAPVPAPAPAPAPVATSAPAPAGSHVRAIR